MSIIYLPLIHYVLGILKIELHIDFFHRKENIQISNSKTLNYVFYVPNLYCNLISISKLIKSSRCFAIFFSILFVFQDLLSRTMIDNAKEYKDLYYFDEANVNKCYQIVKCDSVSFPKNSKILLCLYRKRYPNFQYFK